MSRIYRIQDADGRGPYRPGFTHVWQDDEGPVNPPMPVPVIMALRAAMPRHHHMGFGFVSLEQLRQWFTVPELRKLHVLGYVIAEMGATGILRRDEKQVVFHRRFPFTEGIRVVQLDEVLPRVLATL